MAKVMRKRRGQSTVELLCGMIAVIPIFLLLVDLGSMMLASSVNDNLAKQAARAAANQKTQAEADAAAGKVIDKLIGVGRTDTGVFLKIEAMDAEANAAPLGGARNCDYNQKMPGNVIVTTRITMRIPVTVSGLPQTAAFTSRSSVPIVATVAQ